MKKIKGSALVDYLVPTAIVGLVFGLGLYTMQSSGTLTKFIAASLNINIADNGKGKIGKTTLDSTVASSSSVTVVPLPATVSLSSLKAGDLGGTPSNPVKTCDGGVCALDFGELMLHSVPEDFGSYTESNGTSGGTDLLCAMLEDIANQINDPDTPIDEAADLRDLANLGHFVADAIAQGEGVLETRCTADPTNCMDNLALNFTAEKLSLPTNLNHVLTDFDSKYTIADLLLDGALGGMNIGAKQLGEIRQRKIDDSLYSDYIDENPLFAMIETYDKVQNSTEPQYSSTVKAITEQLFLDLDRVIYNFQESSYMAYSGANEPRHKDPITAVETVAVASYDTSGKTDGELADEILKPQSSIFTDIDSALMCTTGSYDDTGTACSSK